MASPRVSLLSPPTGRPAWQSILADAIRDPEELCHVLGLDPAVATEARRAMADFPLLVPRPYLARMRRGDVSDPLLLQVLPRADELIQSPGFVGDPLGEAGAQCAPGMLRKYSARLLIVATGACAVHCRFCFRRHFAYPVAIEDRSFWQSALQWVETEKSVEEVILSGGDPLSRSDAEISYFIEELARFPHVRRVRVHTRLPVMVPQRVTDGLLEWMRGTRLTTLVVVHVNHRAEVDDEVAAALGRLIDAGVPVLSQSVLLRGVNDSMDVLADLLRRLVDLRVMPYYLHQLDPVAGAAHFRVPEETGRRLIAELRARLPGYAVPRYVRETPGEASKTLLA